MSAGPVRLDFYGVRAELRSASAAALDELRRDFAWFEDRASAPPAVLIELIADHPGDERPRATPTVRHDGEKLSADYGAGRVDYDFSTETGRVASRDPHLLHELAYLLLLSRVGQRLDRRGLHRVHALGFAADGGGALVLLPVGGGKTTLALKLLRESDVRLLSEDTPLVDRRGRLWPFPVRFGVRSETPLPDVPAPMQRVFRRRAYGSKVLIDIDFARDRWAPRAAVPARTILAGDGTFVPLEKESVRRRPRLWAAAGLLSNLVIGIGVPQGREFLLRPRAGAWLQLAAAAFSRGLAALALLARCRVYRLRLGLDSPRSAAAVREAAR